MAVNSNLLNQILAREGVTQGSVQQQAQAAVPVTPNNGNPAGAYNMPQQPQFLQYTSSNPSPYMQQIQQMLSRQQTAQPTQIAQTQQPAVVQPQMQATPVIPTRSY